MNTCQELLENRIQYCHISQVELLMKLHLIVTWCHMGSHSVTAATQNKLAPLKSFDLLVLYKFDYYYYYYYYYYY